MPFLPLATAVLATATLCAPALRAQSTLLTRQGGTIGQQLTWTVKAPKAWFFLPSLTTGPVPLAALDPSDPRSLAIGLDLIALSAVGPAGTHQLPIPIPNDPGFLGHANPCAVLHAARQHLPRGRAEQPGEFAPAQRR
jgi:hypothetical protein